MYTKCENTFMLKDGLSSQGNLLFYTYFARCFTTKIHLQFKSSSKTFYRFKIMTCLPTLCHMLFCKIILNISNRLHRVDLPTETMEYKLNKIERSLKNKYAPK